MCCGISSITCIMQEEGQAQPEQGGSLGPKKKLGLMRILHAGNPVAPPSVQEQEEAVADVVAWMLDAVLVVAGYAGGLVVDGQYPPREVPPQTPTAKAVTSHQ